MPPTLTRKGEATRDRIIRGAAEAIRENGLVSTGLEQIRERTKTSQSQLFHYFPEGKSELLLAVADFEATQILADQRPLLDDLTSWEAWQRWSEKLVEQYEREGIHCGLSALTSQMGADDPRAREIVATMYTEWEAALVEGLRASQDAGEISREVEPEVAAAAIVASIQGGVQLMRSTGSTRFLRAGLMTAVGSLRA